MTGWHPQVNSSNWTDAILPDFTGYRPLCVNEYLRLGVVDATHSCSAEATQRMQVMSIVRGDIVWSTYDEYTITAEVQFDRVRVMKTGTTWSQKYWP